MIVQQALALMFPGLGDIVKEEYARSRQRMRRELRQYNYAHAIENLEVEVVEAVDDIRCDAEPSAATAAQGLAAQETASSSSARYPVGTMIRAARPLLDNYIKQDQTGRVTKILDNGATLHVDFPRPGKKFGEILAVSVSDVKSHGRFPVQQEPMLPALPTETSEQSPLHKARPGKRKVAPVAGAQPMP